MNQKEIIIQTIDENRAQFEAMSDAIWEYAELRFQEHRSAKLQMDFLREQGFSITTPVGTLDTAFVAEYGHGKPVIAIVGEFDALPNMSQVSGITEKKPLVEGGSGHGCGHHMLGTAGVEAAYAVKRWLDAQKREGTVRYYGCPAEEGGCGKVYMIHAGAFDDVDAALSWHPQQTAFLILSSTALVGVEYHFRGKAAHAATNPQQGRSALDAAEIMNIGTNFLREHLPQGVSVQYAFLNAGGVNPNIIPDEAVLLYTIRARSKNDLDDTFARVNDIAKGAALIAGTTLEKPKVRMFYSDILKNETLHAAIRANGHENRNAGLTDADLAEAASFAAVNADRKPAEPIYQKPMQYDVMKASADFGDVSHVVPAGAFTLATYATGTALHSWSAVAQGKTGYAHKVMHKAAKILACTAADLITDAELLQKAKDEFAERMQGEVYTNPLLEEDTAWE